MSASVNGERILWLDRRRREHTARKLSARTQRTRLQLTKNVMDKASQVATVRGIPPCSLRRTTGRNSAAHRVGSTASHLRTIARGQGVFRRQIQFADTVDVDAISAVLDKGVLTLELPIKEGSKARSITIESTMNSKSELATSSS